jgi:hypothetical protein
VAQRQRLDRCRHVRAVRKRQALLLAAEPLAQDREVAHLDLHRPLVACPGGEIQRDNERIARASRDPVARLYGEFDLGPRAASRRSSWADLDSSWQS